MLWRINIQNSSSASWDIISSKSTAGRGTIDRRWSKGGLRVEKEEVDTEAVSFTGIFFDRFLAYIILTMPVN